MKVFPYYDSRTGRNRTAATLETMINVFIDNNGELVDVKPYYCPDKDRSGFVVVYDEYEETV